MSDASDDERLAEIRAQKRERLREKLEAGELGADGSDGAASGAGGAAAEADATPTEPIHVGGPDEFAAVIADHDVVLVDFYADWCGPCKQLEPIVERLAAETDAAVAKVDVDRRRQIAGQYQVRSMPTLILFADGEPADRVVGARGYDHLAGLIRRYT